MTDLVFEPSHTTHWKNLFPNKMLLLGSQNLNQGEELVATITSVGVDKIKDQKGKDEEVPVVQFSNAPPMVLNTTNAKAIAALYGEQYDGWIGKPIQVYATEVNAFGKKQMALRVREVIPAADINVDEYAANLKACTTLDDLKTVFMSLPKHIKPKLVAVKDEVKAEIENAES